MWSEVVQTYPFCILDSLGHQARFGIPCGTVPILCPRGTSYVFTYLVRVVASSANVSLRVAELVLVVVPVQPHLVPLVNIKPGLLLSDPVLRQPGDRATHDAQQDRLYEAVRDVVPLWGVELDPHAQLRVLRSCCVVGDWRRTVHDGTEGRKLRESIYHSSYRLVYSSRSLTRVTKSYLLALRTTQISSYLTKH